MQRSYAKERKMLCSFEKNACPLPNPHSFIQYIQIYIDIYIYRYIYIDIDIDIYDGKNIFIELLHMYSQDPVTIVRVSTSLHRYCLYNQTCGPPFCQYFLSLKLLLHFYYQFSLFFYLLFPRHTLPYKLQKVK